MRRFRAEISVLGPNGEENVNQKHTLFLLQSLIPEALQSLILEEPEAEGRLGMGVWGAKPPNRRDPLYLYIPIRPPKGDRESWGKGGFWGVLAGV